LQQGGDAVRHLLQKRSWNFTGSLGLPLPPIEVFQMVGKNDSLDELAGEIT
jgi:hypothetical protein